MPPMSINDTKHLLTLTNQMPLGLVTEQGKSAPLSKLIVNAYSRGFDNSHCSKPPVERGRVLVFRVFLQHVQLTRAC